MSADTTVEGVLIAITTTPGRSDDDLIGLVRVPGQGPPGSDKLVFIRVPGEVATRLGPLFTTGDTLAVTGHLQPHDYLVVVTARSAVPSPSSPQDATPR